jgi:alpha-tubulin suppressor-like RCC1 family protein
LYAWGTTKYSKFAYSGEDILIPRLIPFNNKIKLIAAGNWHSLIVDEYGDLFAVGHNKYGSCGTGTF